MFIVGHTEKPDFKETYHHTLEEAEQRIEEISQTDPIGVDKGHYYIDGPCNICERCHKLLDYVFIPFIVGYEGELVEWREVTFCPICDKDDPLFAERSYYDKGIYGLTEHGRIP